MSGREICPAPGPMVRPVLPKAPRMSGKEICPAPSPTVRPMLPSSAKRLSRVCSGENLGVEPLLPKKSNTPDPPPPVSTLTMPVAVSPKRSISETNLVRNSAICSGEGVPPLISIWATGSPARLRKATRAFWLENSAGKFLLINVLTAGLLTWAKMSLVGWKVVRVVLSVDNSSSPPGNAVTVVLLDDIGWPVRGSMVKAGLSGPPTPAMPVSFDTSFRLIG